MKAISQVCDKLTDTGLLIKISIFTFSYESITLFVIIL